MTEIPKKFAMFVRFLYPFVDSGRTKKSVRDLDGLSKEMEEDLLG